MNRDRLKRFALTNVRLFARGLSKSVWKTWKQHASLADARMKNFQKIIITRKLEIILKTVLLLVLGIIYGLQTYLMLGRLTFSTSSTNVCRERTPRVFSRTLVPRVQIGILWENKNKTRRLDFQFWAIRVCYHRRMYGGKRFLSYFSCRTKL